MSQKSLDRFIGDFCKIVAKEPGEVRPFVISGVIQSIDYEKGFLLVESPQGIGCINLKNVVAIKPKKQLEHLHAAP